MLRVVCLIAACGMLTGCVLFPSFGVVTTEPPVPISGIRPTEIAALPPGSKVEILWELDYPHTRTVGEVLHASPQGVALMNARIESRYEQTTPVLNKVPYVSRLFKNTGVGMDAVPVQWVPILHMTTARVLEPPPQGYVAPQLAIDTTIAREYERIGIDFDFAVADAIGSPPAANVLPLKSENEPVFETPNLRKSVNGN